MVFSIQMQGGSLDIYRQDIAWEFTNFRFAEGLRGSFSTDIEIPKTNNNCDLLGISGLLDSPSQPFGERIMPCVLEMNGTTMEAYLQVVSVNDDTVSVCLYEKTLPPEEREKNISGIREDDWNTIIAWNVNSLSAYPQWFKKYIYGMTYNANYAQYHPVMKLNDIIDIIAADTDLSIGHVSDDYYTMATRKCLCPQNAKQTLEGVQTADGFRISGGQHVTNDLSFSYGASDTDRLTFDRACHVKMDVWVSWYWNHNGYKVPFVINHHRASDSSNVTQNVQLDAANFVNDVSTGVFDFDVEAGDHISFFVPDGGLFDMVRCVADLTITGYEITEDDYGREMKYVARVPRLIVYNWAANKYDVWWFDSTTWLLAYHKRGTSSTLHRYVQTPYDSFAWFGFWANMPEMTVSDFLYGICWLTGRKIKFGNGDVSFAPPYESTVLENAAITDIAPNSDRFGRKNYVKWDGGETVFVSEINNTWLEPEKDLHTSPFGEIERVGTFVGKTDQYSNPEYDSETGEYKCDFEEVGFLIWCNDSTHNGVTVLNDWMRGLSIKTMGLEEVTQTMTVTIKSFDADVDVDYLYLDGRKFMVVEGDTDLNTKESTVTAVLVPGYAETDKSKPVTKPIWKLVSENVVSSNCVEDKYGNTGMCEKTRTAVYVDINELSQSYNETKTVNETVTVYDPQACPPDTDPYWETGTETMTGYECLTDGYGNTGQCVKTYSTVYTDANPRSATYMQTRTETRTETVTDTTLCPPSTSRADYFRITNVSNSTNTISLETYGNYGLFLIWYSVDDGLTWAFTRTAGNIAVLQPGESVIMKSYDGTGDNGKFVYVQSTADISASGNLASLYVGDNFNNGFINNMRDHAFEGLFAGNRNLVSAENLYFGDFQTVSHGGFRSMFQLCTKLTAPPNLYSLRTIGGSGLEAMFELCTSLTTAPDLSGITSVGTNGIRSMFYGCRLLTTVYAPKITWNTGKSTNWLYEGSASGTLYADPSVIDTIPVDSASGCPTGWTKQSL